MKWNWETGASQSSATDFKTAKNRDTDLEKKHNFTDSISALKTLHGGGKISFELKRSREVRFSIVERMRHEK